MTMNVRDTIREEKLISDVVSSTCLEFALDSPTWTK